MDLINFSQKTKNYSNKLLFLLFSTFPIALITGNLLTNTYIILIGLVFFIFHFNKKLFKNNTFILLNIFFISLIVNLFFTQNIYLSYPRVIKFFFIIYFILSFEHLVKLNNYYDKKIYKVWFFILTIFAIDILVEFFLGQNLLGMKSYIPGRLAGLFGDELVGGYYFYGIIFVTFSYLYKNYKLNNLYLLGLFILIIFISLIIGERANFIRLGIGIFALFFLIFELKLYKKIITSIIILIFAISFINFKTYYKVRFYTQVEKVFQKDGMEKYLKDSIYGAHYDTAYKIFQNNKYFGIGIKNFREESGKSIYINEEYSHTFQRSKTHPHQLHFEVLSETGIFGYVIFLIFFFMSLLISIRQYFNHRNIYQLSAILFILTSLLPYLPSGSFFSTFSSSIFWLNYAIMMGYCKNKVR